MFENRNHTDADDQTPTLIVPAVAECAPRRAALVGGTARIHPSWCSVTSEPEIARGPGPVWRGGSVASVTTASAVTFHRRSGSFQALSAKTGRTISGIGPHEMAQAEEMEVEPAWIDFDLQGLRYSFGCGTTYLSDFHGHHSESGLVAGEVKADRSYFLAAGYAPTMEAAKALSAAVGISFREVTGSALNANVVRRANVRRAYVDRFTTVGPEREASAAALLARDGSVPLGRVEALLANDHRVARAMTHALLCRRVLAFDLNLPVTPATIVGAPARVASIVDLATIELSSPC